MKLIHKIVLCTLTVICFVLVGCTAVANETSVPEREETNSASSSSSGVTTAPDVLITIPSEVVSSKNAFHIAADSYYAGNHFAYLYVTDKEGVPVPNLLLFSEDNWFVRKQGILSKTNGLSMNNGLLPFYLQEHDYESAEHLFVLVNYDDEGKMHVLPLEWNQESFDKLVAGEILSVVWEQPIPSQTAKQMQWAVDIYIETEDGKPAANMAVMLELPRGEGPHPDTGVEIRVDGEIDYDASERFNEPRYTDKDGYVRVSSKLLKPRLQRVPDLCYRILVRDNILVGAELAMTEFITPAYLEGELCKEIRLVLP